MALIRWFGWSVIGKRSENQDAIVAWTPGDGSDLRLFAVADGVGGASGGRIASREALRACMNSLSRSARSEPGSCDLRGMLAAAVEEADVAVGACSVPGMGTTLAAVLMDSSEYVVASIGDSRVYRFDRYGITQVTVDHTSNEHGCRHVLTRALRGNRDAADLFPMDRRAYDVTLETGLLLCSDGLALPREHIVSRLRHLLTGGGGDITGAVEALVNDADAAGSTDNISALCVVTSRADAAG